MQTTGTHFNYYHVCKRKLWLFSNAITFEHTSDLVYEGKLVHEECYPQRSAKYEEIEIDGVKVDFYDARNKIIHEIKKSDKVEMAHEWQLKYYIYVFEKNGISDVSGILEYPKLRETKRISLSDVDRMELDLMKNEITSIVESDHCPPKIKKGICKNCSYFEFCFTEEIED